MKSFWGSKDQCEYCGSKKSIKNLHGEERCAKCLRPKLTAVEKMETK